MFSYFCSGSVHESLELVSKTGRNGAGILCHEIRIMIFDARLNVINACQVLSP